MEIKMSMDTSGFQRGLKEWGDGIKKEFEKDVDTANAIGRTHAGKPVAEVERELRRCTTLLSDEQIRDIAKKIGK